MEETPGPLLAEGKDAQIFDLGGGLVLRRAFDRRSLAEEASVMAYAREAGLPVPAVHEVTPDGAIVMDRVRGRTLLDVVVAGQVDLVTAARTVAELHDLVHALPAPEGIRPCGLEGDRLLHLDLHILNIVWTTDGPVLLDWANARSGPAAADVAMSWFLHGAGTPDEGEEIRALRRSFLEAWLPYLDVVSVRAVLPDVAAWRTADRNVGPAEAEAVRGLAEAFPKVP